MTESVTPSPVTELVTGVAVSVTPTKGCCFGNGGCCFGNPFVTDSVTPDDDFPSVHCWYRLLMESRWPNVPTDRFRTLAATKSLTVRLACGLAMPVMSTICPRLISSAFLPYPYVLRTTVMTTA